MNEEIIQKESNPKKLGEYIYMAMAMINDHKACIAVAYKMDYCIKKAKQVQNEMKRAGIESFNFYKINKVKVGQLVAEKSFFMN